MKDIFQVIDTIQLSEKATLLTETNNEYVFKVNRHANKLEIRQAVEKLFGKKVVAVRTWKKAFVRLAEGESIEFV
jgi:large subunit ribosomal protein L23